ncbi:MAG: helix-turn-helix transcriptional regulator [Cyclobacteriaceae bacterium]
MAINDRIAQLIVELDLNLTSFADSLDVSVPVVHNIVKGRRNKPSFEMLRRITTVYAAVNTDWLLRGNGNVWLPAQVDEETQSVQDKPVIDQDNLDKRLRSLLNLLGENYPEDHVVAELKELIPQLMDQNNYHRDKLVKLYEKNEKMMDILRHHLGLDI